MTSELWSAGIALLSVSAGMSSLYAADYAVGGVVVDSRSHTPVANVRLFLAPTNGRDQKLEQVTKRDGRFAFSVDHPGKYSLQITRPGYPPQAYKQAGFTGVSSAIVVRDDQDTTQIVFEASRGSVIAGVVKDEDAEPVSNALVSIFSSAVIGGERRMVARGQTRANAAGEFRFSSLTSGKYYICAMGRPWFADSLIKLEQIRDQERAPLPDLLSRPAAARQSHSDDDQQGEPEVPAPSFSPDPGFRGTAFVTTFYPRAQTVDEASPVHVDVGGETQISITLPLTKPFSVKGTLSAPGRMSEGQVHLLKKIYDQQVPFLEEWVGEDGSFQFKNVPAGSYEILATSQSGSGESSWTIRQEVEVGGSDLQLSLRPSQMGSLTGRVLFEGHPPASIANLAVSLRNDKTVVARTEVGPDGIISLSRLPPGRYELLARKGDYVAAYLTNQGGKHVPLTFELTSGEAVHLDLTLTRAASVIEGTVEKGGAAHIGAFVLLMPKDPSQRWAYRMDQTDSDGSYRLATIPSGDYLLIALSEGEGVAYRDAKIAAILSQAAKPVHIESGDHLNLKIDVVETANLNLPAS